MIATYAEVRAALLEAAASIPHPTKVLVKKGVEQAHRYGSSKGTVVYREGGNVGVPVKVKGKLHYYVARGDNHEASCYALAHHLGLSAVRRKESAAVLVPDVGVRVDELDEDDFKAFCTSKG